MSNSTFMAEWPELQEPAIKAEALVQADPRPAWPDSSRPYLRQNS